MTATIPPSKSVSLEGFNPEQRREVIERGNELRNLAKKGRLRNKNDLQRRNEIVVWFAERGFTRNQISSMVDGVWDPKTLKHIVKGITPQDTTVRDNVATIFVKMLQNHLDFDDVADVTGLQKRLSQDDVDVDDIVSLEQDMRQSKDLTVEEVIEIFKRVRDQISLPELKEAASFKHELEVAGIKKIEDLKLIVDAARKFGSPDDVLKAVNKFGSLHKIEYDIGIKTPVRDQLLIDIPKLEVQHASILKSVETYNEIRSRGFDPFLDRLDELSTQHPPNDLLERLDRTGSIADLESQQRILQTEVQRLNDEAQGLRNHITSVVEPLKQTINSSLSNFNAMCEIRINSATEASKRYAKMLSRAIFLNNHLRISELIIGATEDRDVVKGIPLEFASKLLQAAYNISHATTPKPVISLSDAGLVSTSNDVIMGNQEFMLSQYIRAARLALDRHIANLKRMNHDGNTETDMVS